MRPTTEPKYTWLLLQGKTPSQAAFTLLTNGTQLNTREKEELENMLCKDLFLACKYKLDRKKGVTWPEFTNALTDWRADTQPAKSAIQLSRADTLTVLIYMHAVTNGLM